MQEWTLPRLRPKPQFRPTPRFRPVPRFCRAMIGIVPWFKAVSPTARFPIRPTVSEGLLSSICAHWRILAIDWLFRFARLDLPWSWPYNIWGFRRQWYCHSGCLQSYPPLGTVSKLMLAVAGAWRMTCTTTQTNRNKDERAVSSTACQTRRSS
jgi:hypothetical protein